MTAAEDGTARVWNAQTGEQWVSFPHPAVVTSAEFGADGHVLTVCADGRARIWDLPIGVENDVTHLVELAEGVAGYRLDENAKLIPSEAHAQTFQALRDAVSKRPAPAETLSAQIVAWFLADRWNRTISPFSKTTVARFVDEQLAADARDEAQRVYPGHPALRPGTVMTGDKQ